MNCMECFINYAEVGERIRRARKSRKWTQAKLAEAVGCTTANITNIERAKTKLSLNMMVRIVEVLELDASEVIGTKKVAESNIFAPMETKLQEIFAGLSPEKVQLCQQACVEFCAAFSHHLEQV